MSTGRKLVVIVGPTAVGKSDLALALAKECRGTILSADAMQIYRGFDRGTGKPTAEEKRLVPHRLIDVADPRHDFSAGDFVRAADEALVECQKRRSRPFLVGGTGLYVRCFLRGIFEGPRRHEALRRRLATARDRHGLSYLVRMLERLDPVTAARIGAADAQRIVRALEVRFATGRPLSDHLAAGRQGNWAGNERMESVKIGLLCDRDELNGRIGRRVARFFAGGLVDEVRGLLASGIAASANAFKGIGYRQAVEVVRGNSSERQAIEETVRATTRYAKRQMTWFRQEKDVHWLQAGAAPEGPLMAAAALIA